MNNSVAVSCISTLVYVALARHGVSREVPCSALKGETVPDSLPAYKSLPLHSQLG